MYPTCAQYYSDRGSRIAQGVLLTSVGWQYERAQRFKVPRFGLYNITAAGASGGRGVCNPERGRGVARTVQVELYPQLELLILVGQQGSSFCDVAPDSTPCSLSNLTDTLACSALWHSYIEQTFHGEGVANVVGGGGGGGASMVRAYNVKGFDPGPIVIGAGGGGTSALLRYDVVNDLGIYSMGSPLRTYQYYINGDGIVASRWDSVAVSNFTYAAGTGGGYSESVGERLDVDGGSLAGVRDFAVGGSHCNHSIHMVNGVFGGGGGACAGGGFGGGGGACAGGGGGGGYLGGTVLSEGRFIPGSGGTSYTGASLGTSFKVITYIKDTLSTQSSDGYVDIVDADCECVFKCEVYHDEDAFQCTCPDGTSLAADDTDCYFGKVLISFCRQLITVCFPIETNEAIIQGPIMMLPPDEHGIVFNYQFFTFANRLILYGVDFEVVVADTGVEDEEESVFENCIIGFIGENHTLVAHTDVHGYGISLSCRSGVFIYSIL